ncbi:flagellar hook-basal body complex protein, partial [Pseudomaricurvus sp.]|uniref:flagellar hook-basal body complex protein n=1 Tax=Pseudomaricurvus sp. TaxID=2004510 RepID=UPI003F6B96E5
MSFNIGLTGIRAADNDLRVTGNNIANASTTGFKRSRAEFGDVYASSIVGTANNAAGSGVMLADIAQQFTQGNITFTDNVLDLSIDGSGFFIMSDGGDVSYTRSGMFSTDNQGYVVNNSGFRLQGYGADDEGNIVNGVLTDLQIDASTQAP